MSFEFCWYSIVVFDIYTLQVLGAYFEKLGSTCFAVYSIAVTDAQNKTWFVKRRFTSFILFFIIAVVNNLSLFGF